MRYVPVGLFFAAARCVGVYHQSLHAHATFLLLDVLVKVASFLFRCGVERGDEENPPDE